MNTNCVGASSTDRPSIPMLQLAFAICVALVVLNLYASQVLVVPITATYGIAEGATGFVSTAALLGYSMGLLLLTPLADIMENRRLVTVLLTANVVALTACASAPIFGLLLVGAFTAGATSCAIQILIPLIASVTDEGRRGRVIGNVMSGLMLGILLSRPLAGFAAESIGWRGSYILAAVGTGAALLLFRAVAWPHQPSAGATWPRLIASLWEILRRENVVRRAALRQGLCMCAFNIFWTSVALRLSQPPFSLSQRGIALFALAGAAGVFAAPLAGRLGDKGQTRAARRIAYAVIALACWISGLASSPMITAEIGREAALVAMTAGAFLLDLGVIIDQALGRREVNLVRPEARGRINGLFTGLFFIGSAVGALTSGIAYAWLGWVGTCSGAGMLGVLLLLLRSSNGRSRREESSGSPPVGTLDDSSGTDGPARPMASRVLCRTPLRNLIQRVLRHSTEG